MRGGIGSDIKSLQGASSLNDIDDVKYMRDKLFSAIKIPQSYLTNLEGADEDKTTLAQKDIRFARTIQRLQRSVVTEMEKIAVVHLYTLGFRGEDLLSFNLTLNNPSRLAELQQLEYMRTKFETATSVPEGTYSKRWVAQNILGLSDDEFLRNQRETFYDRKWQQKLEAVADQGAEEALGGDMGAGDLGDDLGGDLGGVDDGLGDLDLGGEEGDLDAGAEGEDSALLATPARVEDGGVTEGGETRTYANGSYTTTNGDGRKTFGRTRRTFRAQAVGSEALRGRSTRSKTVDGSISDLTFGTKQTNESIYKDGETQMRETTERVRRLVEQLENKVEKKDET